MVKPRKRSMERQRVERAGGEVGGEECWLKGVTPPSPAAMARGGRAPDTSEGPEAEGEKRLPGVKAR